MRKRWIFIVIGCLLIFSAPAEAQLGKILDKLLEGGEQVLRPEYLKVIQLEVSPDPVQEGQGIIFRATITNSSRDSGRVTLLIRDKDQIISEVRNAVLRSGDNQIDFPETTYRLSRSGRCFTIETEVEYTRTPIAAAKEFCARRTQAGWTLSDKGIGWLYVEDLTMHPDPASPGQDIRLKIKLRNDGRPIRGHIQIKDRDQIVTELENAVILQGAKEYQFPPGKYTFQRSDTCFTVSVDIERTPHPVDSSGKQYCVHPVGWTLKPGTKEQRGERGR